MATAYAVMLETEYMKKDMFNKNFWHDWKDKLGSKHVIKDLKKCDFRPIYDWFMSEREKKKELPKEVSSPAFCVQHQEGVSMYRCSHNKPWPLDYAYALMAVDICWSM